ncbi:hypothetical protein EDC04DRAFT_2902140 [Pisolithus marmoratus]|nr:hypothetical protein EDC04DRAFT_2902140 [Pisolithus marmoratus]
MHVSGYREYFYALVNMRQPTGTEVHCQSVKKDRAIEFVSDLFSLEYLRNYIGEIMLFERLPLMIEADVGNSSCESARGKWGRL